MALQLLDVDKFLQKEQAKAVTETVAFNNAMEPTQGGLQDPSIFGRTVKDKFSTWGLIKLEDVIIHPLVYDNINIIDPIFNRVLKKKHNVNIVNGMLEKSDKGGTGLGWLISNWDKINFDRYRTEKNKMFVDFIKNTNKNIIFLSKVPVIPIIYREAKAGDFRMETDELDEIYSAILGTSKTARTDFTSAWMETMKDTTSKEILQNKVNQLYKHFIDKLEGKQGFLRGALTAKRLDNVSRMVANARPDIPMDGAVLPWHILLNLFDVFVVGWLQNDEEGRLANILGIDIDSKTTTEYGEDFDYIYRNSETYVKHYAGRKEAWIEILTNIFNDNPMLRIILKRDPGWNADSIWCFKPLINAEDSYQIWVPSWVYSPLGGDSLNTNFYIDNQDSNVIYEDSRFIITGQNDDTRVIRTMNSVYKRIEGIEGTHDDNT